MASHGLPESAKPADNCGSYWALQEHVADGLGLGGGAAAGKRATVLVFPVANLPFHCTLFEHAVTSLNS